MVSSQILSVMESPTHPDLSELYRQLGLNPVVVSSMRKAISHVKQQAPDFLVAEFIYGYGNNYAGVNISNLDVLLYTLQRYAPQTRVIALADKSERQYVDKLNDIVPIYGIVLQPASVHEIESLIRDANNE